MSFRWLGRTGAVVTLFLCVSFSPVARGDGTLISVPGRAGMVFDHSGKFLYISTWDGFIRRYNLVDGAFDAAWNPGGSLLGIDISPNDSFLLVAQRQEGASDGLVHKLNLTTGDITDIRYPRDSGEGGAWDVAIASNGTALLTTHYNGSGAVQLRQINLATNQISIRSDVPRAEINMDTRVPRSADGRRIYLVQPNDSSCPVVTYDAVTNSFSELVETFYDAAFGLRATNSAVNRNGTLLSTRVFNFVSLDAAPNWTYRHTLVGPDAGVAFDAAADVLYAVSRSEGQIIAYDSNTYAELFRLDIGETLPTGAVLPFDTGALVASNDGRYLALQTPSGVRLYDLVTATHIKPSKPAPSLTDRRDMVFDHSGKFLYVTTWTGLLERYEIATGKLDLVADLGGTLFGIDIAPDDSFVLVAQGVRGVGQGAVQRVNLTTGAVTNINYNCERTEGGVWDVALMSNGRAFVTSAFLGSGFVPLRQLDLSTGTFTVRSDAPFYWGLIDQETSMDRSADRSRVYFLCPNDSSGPVFAYDAVSDHFSKVVGLLEFLEFVGTAAVSRDGSLLATRIRSWMSLDEASDFRLQHIITGIDGGVAFDAVKDIVYGLRLSSHDVLAFDTNTGAELFRMDVGESVGDYFLRQGTGTLVASQDGRYLAVATATGVKVLPVPYPAPTPSPTPVPPPTAARSMVFDRSGHLYATDVNNGFVYKYDAATGAIVTAYYLGGYLAGIDIASDDSFLLVAQILNGIAQAAVQKVDLSTGNVTNLTYGVWGGERGGYSIAIMSNGRAFFSDGFNGSSFVPFRDIDLSSGAVSIRNDYPGGNIYQDAVLLRSGDRNALWVVGLSTAGYDSITNSFYQLSPPDTGWPLALNRDGTIAGLVAGFNSVAIASFPGFDPIHTFTTIDSGVVFDATRDVVYGVDHETGQLIGYDTGTFAEKYRVNVRDAIGMTTAGDSVYVVASSDGRYLAIADKSGGGVHFYSPTGAPTPPPVATPTPPPTGTPSVGLSVSTATVGEGQTATFTISATPNTARPIAVNFSITGKAVFGGDYTLGNAAGPAGQLTIEPGQDSASLIVTAIADHVTEKKKETLTMTLGRGSGYKLRPGKKAKLTILDTP